MVDFSKLGLSAIPDEFLGGVTGGLSQGVEDWARCAISDSKYLLDRTKEETIAHFRKVVPDDKPWKSELLTYIDEIWDRIEPRL